MPDTLDPEIEARAREALAEIAPPGTVGPLAGRTETVDGLFTLTFSTNWSAYPGWLWTITFAQLDDTLTIVEHELLPGNGALLAPDWVPWSVRLADFKAQEEAERAAALAAGAELAEAIDDEEPGDESDDDFDGRAEADDFDDDEESEDDDEDDDFEDAEDDDEDEDDAGVDDLIEDDDELIDVEEQLEDEELEDEDD